MKEAASAPIQNTQNRLDWIDANKGIAIAIVVFYHTTLGLENAGLLAFTKSLHYAWLAMATFATPLFFIMSGYFIEKSLKKAGPKKFFLTSLHYILLPYVIWATVQQGIKILFASVVNTAVDSLNPLLLITTPPAQFWFLHALFIGQILFAVFYFSFNRSHLIVSIVALFLSWVLVDITPIADAMRAFGFLVFGTLLAKHVDRLAHIKSGYAMTLLAMIYVVSLIFYDQVMEPAGFHGMTNFVGGIAVTLLISAFFLNYGAPRLLNILGKYSMYIFVFHILCLVPVRVLYTQAGLDSISVLLIASILAGIVLPVIAAIVIELFGLAAYLGFKPVNFPWRAEFTSPLKEHV